MANVIVAFSKPEDARSIKNILMKNGFPVGAVCASGAQTLAMMGELGSGILVCGCSLTDMVAADLAQDMPPDFSMLLVGSPNRLPPQTGENMVLLSTPLKVHALVETLDMMAQEQARRRRRRRQQPRKRDEKELAILNEAKQLLMERNRMTEEAAHRYIQKSSMDSGTSMIETAQMVIRLLERQQPGEGRTE